MRPQARPGTVAAVRRKRTALLIVTGLLALPAAAPAATSCPDADRSFDAMTAEAGEAALVCMVNEVRAQRGLTAFTVDPRLGRAARAHSEDMAARNYFEHDSPEGETPSQRAQRAGYGTFVAENIALGYPTPGVMMKGWLESAGHCSNILSAGMIDIGVGVSPARPYATLVTGRQQGAAPPGNPEGPARSCPVDPDGRPFSAGEQPGQQDETTGGTSADFARRSIEATLRRIGIVARARVENTSALRAMRLRLRLVRGRAVRSRTFVVPEGGTVTVQLPRPRGKGRTTATLEVQTNRGWVRLRRILLPSR